MSEAPPPPPSTVAPSISTADVPRQLAAAEGAWRPIRRAARYATADAWTLAVCAVLSFTCLFGDPTSMAAGVVLGILAFVEFREVRRLRRLDPVALRRLAINQLVLAGVAVAYALLNLYLIYVGRGLLAYVGAQLSTQGVDHETLSQSMDMARGILYLLYGSLAVIGGLVPALTAWSYASKQVKLRAYLAETPEWIMRMQQERGQL